MSEAVLTAPSDPRPGRVIAALSLYSIAAPPIGLAMLLAASSTIDQMWTDIPVAVAFISTVILGVLLVGCALLPSIGFAGFVGYLFHGEAQGYLAVVLAITGATYLGLAWARRLSSTAAQQLLDRYPKGRNTLALMERESGRSLLGLVFMSRLSPHMPFAFTNILIAQLDQPLQRLALFSTLGLLPRSLIAVALGAGLRSAQDWPGLSSPGAWTWIITAVVLLLFVRIAWKAVRAARSTTVS